MYKKKYQRPHHGAMKWILFLSPVFICLEVLLAGVGWTYEALPGFTGKQLTGTVKLKGEITPPKRFNLVLFSDPYYCGRISDGRGWRITPTPGLGEHDELPGAVVYLEEVKKGKPGTTSPNIIQTKNCVFLPYISATQVGQTFHFQNWDPIQHKLEVFLTSQKGAQSLLGENLQTHPENRKSDFLSSDPTGLHRSGPEVQYRIDRPGILVFRCRLHDFMEGWSIVLPHPYFSMTGKNGEFSIKDIPEGVYKLVAWHPGMAGFLDMKVVVVGNETMKIRMEFPEPRDRRMAHNTMSPTYRFGTRALEREGAIIDIQVTHEDQGNQGKH